MQTVSSHPTDVHRHDAEYDAFMGRVQKRFQINAQSNRPLFTTNAAYLWDVYLNSFSDPADQQYHNCNSCRHFIQRFGGLATIDEHGHHDSAIWNEDDAPLFYRAGLYAMRKAVQRAKVDGVFVSDLRVWGEPRTGQWMHFAVTPAQARLHTRRDLTPFQVMAEKSEDFKNMGVALAAFPKKLTDQLQQIIDADALYRNEKIQGPGQWLCTVQNRRTASPKHLRDNLLWQAVALAPAGFCHPRSSMIGTVLDDLKMGMDFATVAKRFKDKMDPLQYQRPQAAPKAGAIGAAEKLVEKLGIARSLERRFARPGEIVALWRPNNPGRDTLDTKSVFGHLKPSTPGAKVELPQTIMTWAKFRDTLLQDAIRIQIKVPAIGPFCGFLSAVDYNAPPILQWDSERFRNPVSWYFYSTMPSARTFNLTPGFVDVAAVTLKPSMWGGGDTNHGNGVMFVVEGARDTRGPTMGLFPEILKSELHGARAVIEAHSHSGKPARNPDDAQVAGLMYNAGPDKQWGVELSVHLKNGGARSVKLDRWD